MSSFKTKLLIFLIALVAVAVVVFVVYQVALLRKAHSSFENYYVFRGCARLLNRTSDYGICQTNTGQVIKIVKFRNQWYLNGDLPFCWGNFCL